MKVSQKNQELIIQKITGLSKEQLFLNPENIKPFQNKIHKSFQRLARGEPIEYIIKNAEFYGYDFFVDQRVLIPRNETELLVETILNQIKTKSPFTLIDIGTGSGCIPISIMNNIPQTTKKQKFFATDISKDALTVAKINAKKYGYQTALTFYEGDLCNPVWNIIPKKPEETLYITANLPYIKNNDSKNMDKTVIKYEPDTALYGGPHNGFELYEKLIQQCMDLKHQKHISSFHLCIEIGFDQYETAKTMLQQYAFPYQFYTDHNNIQRCIWIEII